MKPLETEWISILDVIKKGHFDASIITTFNAYLPFYEEVVLRHLASAGCRHNVLMMDAGQFSDCLQTPSLRPYSAGYNYTLIPMSFTGAFHPKLILLVSRKKGLLFVGSHNMTLSGLGLNKELTTRIDISDGGQKQGIRIAQSAWTSIEKWMNKQVGKLPSQLFSSLQSFKRFAPWLIKPADGEQTELSFFGSDPDEELFWEKVSEEITGPIKRVTAIGPYFDNHMAFLHRLKRDLDPREIFVGVDPDSVTIPNSGKRKSQFTFVDASSLPESQGFLHAKAIYVEAESGDSWLIVGSANPTGAAWIAPATSRNVEAVLLMRGESAVDNAAKVGIPEICTLPPIDEDAWTRIDSRSILEKSTDSTGGLGRRFAVGIAGTKAIQIARSEFSHEGFIEAKCVDESQNTIATVRDYALLDDHIELPVPEGLLEVRFAEIYLKDSKTLTCLIHHEGEINRRSISSRQVQFRRTLASLQSDSPDLENLIKTVEKIIFDEPFEIDPNAKTRPKAKSGPARPETKNELETLAIDLDETKREKHRKRLVTSGDIGQLLDILIHQLGLGLDRNTEGIDKKGRSEEELVDSDDDDDERDPEVIDMPKMVRICNGKVRRLVKRMTKNFEQTDEEKTGYCRCLMKLLAVLALSKELRALDYRLTGIPFDESLVPMEARERLLHNSLKYLYGRNHQFLKETARELAEEAWDELSRLHGLLLWLAKDCGADLEDEKIFGESWEDKKMRTTKRSYMLLIAPDSVTDPVALREAETDIERTTPIFKKADSKNWIIRQEALGKKLSLLQKRAHLVHHKVKGLPRVGDMAFLRDQVAPTFHIVLQTGKEVVLTDICGKDGKRRVTGSQVAGVPFLKYGR